MARVLALLTFDGLVLNWSILSCLVAALFLPLTGELFPSEPDSEWSLLRVRVFLDAAGDEVDFLDGVTGDGSLSILIGDDGSLSELSFFTGVALVRRVFLTGDDSSEEDGADLFCVFPLGLSLAAVTEVFFEAPLICFSFVTLLSLFFPRRGEEFAEEELEFVCLGGLPGLLG